MILTLAEKKAIVGFGAFLAGVLFLRRALAKEPAKGEVFVDKVEVEKAEFTPQDQTDLVLANLQRQAMETLAVDLDEMAPTRVPTPLQTLEVEGTISKLKAAGKTSEANFLAQLLHEAQSLGTENA